MPIAEAMDKPAPTAAIPDIMANGTTPSRIGTMSLVPAKKPSLPPNMLIHPVSYQGSPF